MPNQSLSSRPRVATTCPICHETHMYIPGTRSGRKCQPCRKGQLAATYQRARHLRGHPIILCAKCGTALPTVTGKGKRHSLCVTCHRLHLRDLDMRRYYERRRKFVKTTTCVDCRSEFPRTGKGGPIPKRCPACAKVITRDQNRAHAQKWHARKRHLPADTVLPSEIFVRDCWVCQLCQEKIDAKLRWPDPKSASIDHITPLSRGGHHVRKNLQATHLVCNLRKATRSGLKGDVCLNVV